MIRTIISSDVVCPSVDYRLNSCYQHAVSEIISRETKQTRSRSKTPYDEVEKIKVDCQSNGISTILAIIMLSY